MNLKLADDETEMFESSIKSETTKHPIAAAYFKGRLCSQVALRSAIKQSAQNESNSSQQTSYDS